MKIIKISATDIQRQKLINFLKQNEIQYKDLGENIIVNISGMGITGNNLSVGTGISWDAIEGIRKNYGAITRMLSYGEYEVAFGVAGISCRKMIINSKNLMDKRGFKIHKNFIYNSSYVNDLQIGSKLNIPAYERESPFTIALIGENEIKTKMLMGTDGRVFMKELFGKNVNFPDFPWMEEFL